MATYLYEAMNNLGQPIKDQIEATSSEEAIAKIRQLGYFPTKIKEKASAKKAAAKKTAGKAGAAAGTGSRRTAGRVPQKILTQCTRQLSTLIDAGLPILRSLRILEEQQKPGPMRVALRVVAEDVEAGSSLSEAMGRHPRAFSRLYVNMVHAGELGGVLDTILQRLADFMERAQALRRKIIGAMVYPVAVLSFALLIVTGLMYFVIPSFKEIFDGMKVELPAVTQALLDISDWIVSGGWLAVLGMPVAIWLLFRLMKMAQSGRYFVDSLKLHTPILGQIASKGAVARFSRTLGTLIDAGVPILDALTITADTSGNEVYSRALLKVRDAIREGESLAEPLRQTRVVEPMVVNMIDVGDETGALDQMLAKVADTYEDEVETLISSLTSLLEPVMVIVLGVIVGFIVLALFMPMVSMIENVSGK
jgi:type IV pilus assembly protein PilC